MPAYPPAGFEPFDEPGTFIGLLGPLYRRTEAGRVVLCLAIEPRHMNPMGTAHGGCLMTLMDITLGMNVGAAIGQSVPLPTVQLNANMLAAARGGDIVRAEASVDRSTKTFAFVSGRLLVADRLIMTASAIFRYPPGVELGRG